jgi:uroporphyrinogen-III decarboxylase
MRLLGCDIVDLDHMVPIAEARSKMGPDQVLCGNLDPVSLLQDSSPDIILKAIEKCRVDAGGRYIVGAGCELTRATPKENITALRDYARSQR